MGVKINVTCISCPTCSRPLDIIGPEEKKVALAVASNRRNSLRANILATQDQIESLERNKQDKAKMLLAEIARNQVAVWMEEELELIDFIQLHDSFRAKR